MANYWYGKTLGIKVSNKALNNTGIESVVASPVGSATLPFTSGTSTSVTNKNAGTVTDSVATYTLVAKSGTAASTTYAANTINFKVNWSGAGQIGTDNHPLGAAIVLCREATSASVSASATEVWSDGTLPTFTVSAAAATGETAFTTAPKATWASDNSSVVVASSARNSVTPTFGATATIDGSASIKLTATTQASETPSADVAASTALTASKTITVKNAVASLTLACGDAQGHNDQEAVYLKVGETCTAQYSGTADKAGKVYNDTVSIVETSDPSDAISESAITKGTNSTSGFGGTFVVTGNAVGVASVKVTSSAASSTISSNIINYYVTPASVDEIKLNAGDVYYYTEGAKAIYVGNADGIKEYTGTRFDVSVVDGYLKVVAKNTAGIAAGSETITLQSGLKVTATLQHISVALA